MPPAKRVTVVIATANRRDELCTTVHRLLELPESPVIVVVDNHSADGSPETVRRCFPAVRLIALSSNEGAAARTVGARAAPTAYVAFCDDDSWWEPGALTVAADRLDADDRLGLVAAKVLVGPAATVDPVSNLMAAGLLDDRLRPNPAGPRGVVGFLACGAVVRRSAFLAVGGFDSFLCLGGEEELVALDLATGGWKLSYLPGAVVRHYPSPRRDVLERRRRLVRNNLLTAGLRYSTRTIGRRIAAAARDAGGRPGAWRGIADAAVSVPWVLSLRRAAPAEMEAVFAHTASSAGRPPREALA